MSPSDLITQYLVTPSPQISDTLVGPEETDGPKSE